MLPYGVVRARVLPSESCRKKRFSPHLIWETGRPVSGSRTIEVWSSMRLSPRTLFWKRVPA